MAHVREDSLVAIEVTMGDPPYMSHLVIDGREIPVKWFSVHAEVNPPVAHVEFEAFATLRVKGEVHEGDIFETRILDPSELDPDGPFGATKRFLAGKTSGCCAHPLGHKNPWDD